MQSESNNGVSIVAIIPLTGAYADVGNWMKAGFELALEDIADSKTKVNIVYEDSQSKPNIAIGAYQKQTTHKGNHIFISTVSPVCLALKPLVSRDKNFMLVNAGHRDILTDEKEAIFRHALTITQEAEFISSYMKECGKIPPDAKISFVYTNNDIGIEFREVFVKNMNGFRINALPYDENEVSLKNLVTKSLSSRPDIVAIYGYTKNFGQLIKTFREQNYKGVIFANQGFSTPSVIESAGNAGNNVFYSDYDIPNNQQIDLLQKRMKEKFGTSLSSMNITAYNAIFLITEAIKKSGKNDPDSISIYLKEHSPYSINGMEIQVKPNGDIYVPLKMVRNVYEK